MSINDIFQEKKLFITGDYHCYFEYTDDQEAIKRCFKEMAKFCQENKDCCFDYVKIVIKDNPRPSIGIKWHVGEDEH